MIIKTDDFKKEATKVKFYFEYLRLKRKPFAFYKNSKHYIPDDDDDKEIDACYSKIKSFAFLSYCFIFFIIQSILWLIFDQSAFAANIASLEFVLLLILFDINIILFLIDLCKKPKIPTFNYYYHLYYESKVIKIIDYEIDDENNESEILAKHKFYGIIFCLLKSSNWLKIASLNGFFEDSKFINNFESYSTNYNVNQEYEINRPLLENPESDSINNYTESNNLTTNENKEQNNEVQHALNNADQKPQNNSEEIESISKVDVEDKKNENKIKACIKGFFTWYYSERKRKFWIKLVIIILILIHQFIYFWFSFQRNTILKQDFICSIIMKIFFIYKIIAYNIFDLLLYPANVFKSLKEKGFRTPYGLTIIFYIIGAIFCICIHCKSPKKLNVTNLKFYDESSIWYKNDKNKYFSRESGCFIRPTTNNILNTEDFSMLTTLPRLYGVTENGKCYLKPSMRGVFNSTMKYIFGKNYEEKEILIFCKKLSHNIVLIMSSDLFLNETLKFYKDDNITILDKQFNISNTDYFQDNSHLNLTDELDELFQIYNECVQINGSKFCENEWDNFTQKYWPTVYTDQYSNISGFERYQISIDSDLIFQPSFITSKGELMAGTHIIISGSYEDKWGIAFLCETTSQKFAHKFINIIVPMYQMIRQWLRTVFIHLEYINSFYNIYNEKIIKPEITSLTKLYSQFNFSYESLFAIGHNIGGTVIKGVSYYNNIKGIAFESSYADNIVKDIFDSKFKTSKKGIKKIANVYGKNSFISGVDEDFYMNFELPKSHMIPNVYETACITSIMCSETMKYVPFCKQVLSQRKFYKSLNSYLDEYGYN